jgi:hypothetical protein
VLQSLQDLQDYKDTKDTQIQDIYKIYNVQDVQDINNYTLGPSMPQVALTPLGLPSLATNHKSTQGSKQVMPPQVGYSITYFIHTTTILINKIFNDKPNAHINMKEIETIVASKDINNEIITSVFAYHTSTSPQTYTSDLCN